MLFPSPRCRWLKTLVLTSSFWRWVIIFDLFARRSLFLAACHLYSHGRVCFWGCRDLRYSYFQNLTSSFQVSFKLSLLEGPFCRCPYFLLCDDILFPLAQISDLSFCCFLPLHVRYVCRWMCVRPQSRCCILCIMFSAFLGGRDFLICIDMVADIVMLIGMFTS